jgi:hypothetical protein
MTNERMDWALSQAEPATYTALRRHGYEVQRYGQDDLIAAAREMLRGVPTPARWRPDFIACRPAVTDRPRWPDAIRSKYAFLVDAKYRWPNKRNHTIEMRSLLAAPTFGMDVFYVCSTRQGDECVDFGVIHHEQVIRSHHRPCCAVCWKAFTTSPDPIRELPEYCPNQQRNREASGTPYVVFPPSELHPLSDGVFDMLSPDQLRKLGPPYGLRERP